MIETNRLLIRLPEGVQFSFRLAGPLTRFLAWVVDMVCIVAITSMLGTIGTLFEVVARDVATATLTLCYFVIMIGYSILLEWAWRGQTVGKRLFKLRVLDADGMRLKFGQIVVRNLLRFIDMLPAFYMLGGVVCLLSKKNQRLGDVAGNTIVVRQTEPLRPDLEKLMEGKFNSLRAHPHLAARLRQKVEPAQSALLLRALLRRDEIDAASRLKFFGLAAQELRTLVPFPDEVTESLSDEAHVRNVVDVIYRPRLK